MKNRFFNKLNLIFLYLVIIALFGAYLRFMFVYDPGIIKYKYLLHSHSHVAMLGWIYNALYIALLYTFLPGSLNSRKYNIIFWITQVSVIGMMFSFAVQGYAAVSISFSTLHIIMSYIFIFCFISDVRIYKSENSVSLKFIYGGLFFLFLSSFGPWGLAVIISQGLAETELYTQAIYFYLHFQYNGWFIFTLIGLWLFKIEKQISINDKKEIKYSFLILFISNFPAYFLSLLGFKIHFLFWIVSFVCALVQLYGARKLYKVLFAYENYIFSENNKHNKLLFRISFLLLFIKFIMQFISSLPGAGSPAFVSREVVIGYIHIVMLGVVTLGILGWFGYNNLIKIRAQGLKIFLAGFILSEVLLFYPSFVLWFHAPVIPFFGEILFAGTILMMVGIFFIYIDFIKMYKAEFRESNN